MSVVQVKTSVNKLSVIHKKLHEDINSLYPLLTSSDFKVLHQCTRDLAEVIRIYNRILNDYDTDPQYIRARLSDLTEKHNEMINEMRKLQSTIDAHVRK